MNTSIQVMIQCPETFTKVFQAGKKLIQSRSTNSKISVNGLDFKVQQQLLSFRQERDEERTWVRLEAHLIAARRAHKSKTLVGSSSSIRNKQR